MDEFARRPRRERAEVFEETSARQGIGRSTIVEKDFWVCWTLHQLRDFFGNPAESPTTADPEAAAGLLFKGGTSLSKVYAVIERFSEDIDLTIDRRTLGFVGETEPGADGLSRTKREHLLSDLAIASAKYVRDVITPHLEESLRNVGDADASLNSTGVRVDEHDPQTLHLAYPKSLERTSYAAVAYVQAEVRLEFGARGELWPAHRAEVQSYAAQHFPDLFAHPSASISVLDLERTFWEKATILHEIAHAGLRGRSRLSRHYYDLSRLVDTERGRAARANVDLLARVAEYKSIMFRQPRAKYELARAGTLRLVPEKSSVDELALDYTAMREMFFVDPPPFASVMDVIRALEAEINGIE